MSPSDIETMARRRYNAVSDTFWSQQEIFDMIWAACQEVSEETHLIEATYSTSTVSGTQGYDFPSYAMAIRRVTWDGVKLTPIDMREDDAITAMDQDTTDTGNPRYYWIWNRVLYLRPIPGSVATLKLWTLNQQPEITSDSVSVLLPEEHHHRLINYVLSGMAAKDSNFSAAQYYLALWDRDKLEMKKAMRKMRIADGFKSVKDEYLSIESYIGGP